MSSDNSFSTKRRSAVSSGLEGRTGNTCSASCCNGYPTGESDVVKQAVAKEDGAERENDDYC